MKKIVSGRTGMSLVAVLVASVIGSIVLVFFINMMSTMYKSNRHAELGADETALRNSLTALIDCEQTWTANAVAPATDCFPATSAKALTLKNRSGGDITSAVTAVSGTFDPLSANFEGSGTLGSWALRAYCDQTLQSVVLRAARVGADGNFAQDPLNKRKLDWSDRNNNPVFGPAGRSLCGQKFGVGGVGMVRVESATDVLASACAGTAQPDHNCNGIPYLDIVFATPFSAPPVVQVSPVLICDGVFAPCTAGATDQIRTYAMNVTKTGFRMVCAGSPLNPFCPGTSGFACGGRCSWTAIGS